MDGKRQEKSGKDDYPELLGDIAEQVAVKLVALGVPRDKAAEVGLAAAEHIRQHWGGTSHYIPRGTYWQASQRASEIATKFTGNNHGELARQYGITEMRVYQILKQDRQRHHASVQGDLFSGQAR